MEDIIVKSRLNVKTLFNISMLIFFQARKLMFILIYFAALQFLLFWYSAFDWVTEIVMVAFVLLFYCGVMPLIIYIGCVRRSKVSSAFLEDSIYTFNREKIEIKAETVSATNNWKYILKCIEREKYFLLMLSARLFYYLPKDGFESAPEIVRFKNLVKEKGIKMKFH
jgi:hypothetical protein